MRTSQQGALFEIWLCYLPNWWPEYTFHQTLPSLAEVGLACKTNLEPSQLFADWENSRVNCLYCSGFIIVMPSQLDYEFKNGLVNSQLQDSLLMFLLKDRIPLLNQIQHNALSFFFGLGKTAPNVALIGDSEWIPLQMHLQFTVLKFWLRACSLCPNRLVRKVFIWASEIAA